MISRLYKQLQKGALANPENHPECGNGHRPNVLGMGKV